MDKTKILAGILIVESRFSKEMKRQLDYAEYGGAPLIGINGTCVITHGNSNSKEIKNGIKVAAQYIKNDVNKEIIDVLKEYGVNKLNLLSWER